MISTKNIFGKNLKQLRKSKKLNQEAVSIVAGITFQALGNIERGERFTSSDTIDKICNTYNITPDLLFKPDGYNFLNSTERQENINNILTMLNSMDDKQIKTVMELTAVIYGLGENTEAVNNDNTK